MSVLREGPSQLQWTAPNGRAFQCQTPNAPFLDELFQSKTVLGRRGNPIPLEVYIPKLEGELLYSIVRYLRPMATMEIGLANGISALYIAQALRDNGMGRHLAIDPFQHTDWEEAGLVTLERANLDELVTLEARPSHSVLPDLEQEGLRVQFAFVDGNHLFDYVMADFLGIDRILDVGGLIAFDDSDWPAVTSVIRFALANRAYGVFRTGHVVEPAPIRPRWASRALRVLAIRLPALQRILHPGFLAPNHSLGIEGRFVVLKKLADDQRDSQSRHFVPF